MVFPRLDDYQLDETLGRSSLGITYVAHKRETTLAVKVLEVRTDISGSERRAVIADFRKRAAAITGLFHPGIVHVRDYGVLRLSQL